MSRRRILTLGIVMCLLMTGVSVLRAGAPIKPDDPLTAHIGRCLWLLTPMGGFPGTLRENGDRFLTVVVPTAYIGDGGVNPILMSWTQVISAAVLTDPGACAEDAPLLSADDQPLSRLDVRGRQ